MDSVASPCSGQQKHVFLVLLRLDEEGSKENVSMRKTCQPHTERSPAQNPTHCPFAATRLTTIFLTLKLKTVFNIIQQQKSQFSTYQILCVPIVLVLSSKTFSVLFHLSSINIQVKTDPNTGSPGVIYAFILSGTSRNPSLASN